MRMMADGQLAALPSSRALNCLILAEFDQPRPIRLGGNTGLPEEAIDCLEQNLIVAITSATERLCDDALIRFADRSRRDVVLLRHGDYPGLLNPVRADVHCGPRSGASAAGTPNWLGETARTRRPGK